MTAVISACTKKSIKTGEFLCGYFNIEDGRQYITFWAYYALLFQKAKNTTEMQENICAVCREGSVTDQMCQKRFAKFGGGDFSLYNAPWYQLKLIAITSKY